MYFIYMLPNCYVYIYSHCQFIVIFIVLYFMRTRERPDGALDGVEQRVRHEPRQLVRVAVEVLRGDAGAQPLVRDGEVARAVAGELERRDDALE